MLTMGGLSKVLPCWLYVLGNVDVSLMSEEIQAIRKLRCATVWNVCTALQKNKKRTLCSWDLSSVTTPTFLCLRGWIWAIAIIQHHSSSPPLPQGFSLDTLWVWEFRISSLFALFECSVDACHISGARCASSTASAHWEFGLAVKRELCNPGTENVPS